MVQVVFIAPRFLGNTNRDVRAFAELVRSGEIALSLVSADPEDAIPSRCARTSPGTTGSPT